ncbi:Serine/threonine-protein phosphatase [Entamoeba marina]
MDDSSVITNSIQNVFMEFSMVSIRGWFTSKQKPMPIFFITRKQSLMCSVVKLCFKKGKCMRLHVFSIFGNCLDDKQFKQHSDHYELQLDCFDYRNNFYKYQGTTFFLQQFNKTNNVIEQLQYEMNDSLKIASYVLKTIRSYFNPSHGYKYKYGEKSYQWENNENKLTFEVLLELIKHAKTILLNDSNVVYIQPPCYMIGDIHGNYRDTISLIQLLGLLPGTSICPSKFLFLGDYVDRGSHQLELIAFILSLKIVSPKRIFLLRGNHEVKSVNGNIADFGKLSFLGHCCTTFGKENGKIIWEEFNKVFDCLPLCAVVDEKLFCVHGGIARALCVKDINPLEKLEEIERPCSNITHLISDLLWSDPSDPEQEKKYKKDSSGFIQGRRGKGTVMFGKEAVNQFLKNSGCKFIVRAHQMLETGFGKKHRDKVITVFSSSHYCGLGNTAASLLVNNGLLSVIFVTGKDYIRVSGEQSIWENSEIDNTSELY